MKSPEEIKERIEKLYNLITENRKYIAENDIGYQAEDEILQDNYQIKQRIEILKWVLK